MMKMNQRANDLRQRSLGAKVVFGIQTDTHSGPTARPGPQSGLYIGRSDVTVICGHDTISML